MNQGSSIGQTTQRKATTMSTPRTRTIKAAVSVLIFLSAIGSSRAFYNPNTGRWLSRDPVCEAGFRALAAEQTTSCRTNVEVTSYCFADNDPISKLDRLGLDIWYQVCYISCACRWNIHVVWCVTPRPVEDAKGKLCCRATREFFCASAMGIPDRIAADLFFKKCIWSWAGL
jgi:hypothetical protein